MLYVPRDPAGLAHAVAELHLEPGERVTVLVTESPASLALAEFRTWAYDELALLTQSAVRNPGQEQTMRAVIHRLHTVQDTSDSQCPNCLARKGGPS